MTPINLTSQAVEIAQGDHAATVVDKRGGLSAIKVYSFQQEACWQMNGIEDWSVDEQQLRAVQRPGLTQAQAICAAKASIFLSFGSPEQYPLTGEFYDAAEQNYVCAAASGDPQFSATSVSLSMSGMSPNLGYALNEKLLIAAAATRPNDAQMLAIFCCDGGDPDWPQGQCKDRQKSDAVLATIHKATGHPPVDDVKLRLAPGDSIQQVKLFNGAPVEGNPHYSTLVVAHVPNHDDIWVQVNSVPLSVPNVGLTYARFLFGRIDADTDLISLAYAPDEEVQIPRFAGETTGYITLQTSEEGNGVYYFTLLFAFDPDLRAIVLKHTLLAVNLDDCDRSLMGLYEVKDDSLTDLPLDAFNSAPVFDALRKLYVDSQAASSSTARIMPFAVSEQVDHAAKAYKAKSTQAFKDAMAGLVFNGGKCDAQRYIAQTYFYPARLQWSNDLGFYFEQAGYYPEAIALLSKVIAVAPERTPAYLNLADAFWGQGDKPQALINYRRYQEQMNQKHLTLPARVEQRLSSG